MVDRTPGRRIASVVFGLAGCAIFAVVGCVKPAAPTSSAAVPASVQASSADPALAAEIANLAKQVKALETSIRILDHRLELMDKATERPAIKPSIVKSSVSERLQKHITITFARNTLEVTLQVISEDIGVPIEMIVGDLQLDGITKNQSFGLDERDRPAIEILEKVLKLANPDGKLVYVIKPQPVTGEDAIWLTTRAAVAKRGDTLPENLRNPPPRRVQPAAPAEPPPNRKSDFDPFATPS